MYSLADNKSLAQIDYKFVSSKKIIQKEIFTGKKRKAIVKGNAAVEFGKTASGASFLGVGLMS